jgi:hypothetical protein
MAAKKDNWFVILMTTTLVTVVLGICGYLSAGLVSDFKEAMKETTKDIKILKETKVDKADFNKEVIRIDKELEKKANSSEIENLLLRILNMQEQTVAEKKKAYKEYQEYIKDAKETNSYIKNRNYSESNK